MTNEPLWDAELDTRPWDATQRAGLDLLPGLLDRLRRSSTRWEERFADVRLPETPGFDDLAGVPFTTKEDLRAAQAGATAERPLGDFQGAATDELVQVTSSSGTTGVPVYFGLTRTDHRRWSAAIANAFWTAGVRPESTVALTTGMPMVAGGLPYADGIREAGGALAWVGGQTTPRMATTFDRIRVTTLVGTTSFTAHFAARCEEELGKPATEMAVRTVIAGGEPGLGVPEIRQAIADAWGATRVSEFMGLGDVLPALWAECSMGGGMHFTAGADVLVELIDPETGRHLPWEPGALGEAVYTTIAREASPVVRFRSRDHMQVTGVACACGRTSPTVRCVGRTDDMLIYKAMNVFPSAIREVALEAGGDALAGPLRIRKASADQVRFDDPIPLEIEVRDGVDANRRAEVVAAIEDAVRQRLNVRVRPEPLAAGTIPVSDYKNPLTYS